MAKIQCPTCDRTFQRQGHLDNHLHKKNKCQPTIPQNTTNGSQNTTNEPHDITNRSQNITLLGILRPQNITLPDIPVLPNITLPDISRPQNITLPDIPDPQNITLPPIPEEFTCDHCDKIFARKNALCRHIKKYCKVLNQQKIDQQEMIEKLKSLEMKNKQLEEDIKNKEKQYEEKIKKLKDEINTKQIITINGNVGNTNITNNNINITAHGQEDLSKMGDVVLMAACRRGINIVPDLISRTHFNTRLPEFHNVYIPSIKDKHVMVFDKVWELKDTNEVISNLYDTKFDYIIDNKDHFYPFLTEGEKRVFQRWEETNKNRNSDDFKEFIKDMNEKIKLLMYNKREMVIETKKRQEIKK